MSQKSYWKINSELVLIKLHYFVFFGGLGGALPYGILYGRSLNINATALGFFFTAVKCLVLLSKPLIGSLVDYYQNIKLFLIGSIIFTIITGLSLLLIPPINVEIKECANKELDISVVSEDSAERQSNQTHINYHKSSRTNCTLTLKTRNTTESTVGNSSSQWKPFESKNLSNFQFSTPSNDNSINISMNFELPSDDQVHINLTKSVSCESNCSYSKLDPKGRNTETTMTIYNSYLFWIIALLFVLHGVAVDNGFSLSDIACYEMLGNQKQLYGTQRLFGTIGWATICILTGFLNEISSEYSSKKDYSPGYYIMGVFLAIDILIVSKINVVKSKVSKDILGDLKKVMRSYDITLFAVGVIAIGILTSTVSNFELWYLQDLGASQTLMGATIFMQCAVEVPFFAVSAWFIKKFGDFNCLVISFGAFAIRFGLYYLIYNPWWALAIDTTHGMTFALFHFSMNNFASMNAPEGTEATVLGILSGLTSGLGAVIGNLLSGVALDKYGGRLTFCIASVVSVVCAVCFATLPRIIIRNKNTSSETQGEECEKVNILETTI